MKTRIDHTIAEIAESKAAEDRFPKLNRRDFAALSVGTGVTAGFALAAAQPGMAQTNNESRFPMAYSHKHIVTPLGDIAYTEQGKGPVALFVHGVFKNAYFWRHVIERVSDLRRCIAVDLMAHGATRIAVKFTNRGDWLPAHVLKISEVPGEWARNPKRVSTPFDPEYGEDSLHFSYNYPELLKLLN